MKNCTAFVRKSSQVGYGLHGVAFYDIALVDDSGKRVASKSGFKIAGHGTKEAVLSLAKEMGYTLGEVWISEGIGYGWETLLPTWAGGRRCLNPMAESRQAN